MAKPFSALPFIMDQRRREFLGGVNKISRQAAAVAGQAAVLGTRVDTGLARSNWRATVNVPASTVILPYAPGSNLGIGEQGNALGTLAQHRTALATWNAVRNQVFFITNNVSYIATLNFGGPTVAPGNMLALARQAWLAKVKTPGRILK